MYSTKKHHAPPLENSSISQIPSNIITVSTYYLYSVPTFHFTVPFCKDDCIKLLEGKIEETTKKEKERGRGGEEEHS